MLRWFLLTFYDKHDRVVSAAFIEGFDGSDAVERSWNQGIFSREAAMVIPCDPVRLPSKEWRNRRLNAEEIEELFGAAFTEKRGDGRLYDRQVIS